MIILPAEQELNWRRPPIATLFLIVLNSLVFFFYQSGDVQRYDDATDYYVESGLLEREAELYLAFVEETEGIVQRQNLISHAEEYSLAALTDYIVMDLEFSAHIKKIALERDDVLWDSKREAFTQLQRKVSFVAYGFVPAEPTVQGFFGNIFLHGDFNHLLGNMLFLFVCGFALEIAFGRGWYLGMYLLAGTFSSALSYVTGMESFIPEIGASGAVSGLMGMYVALYGMKQIQFFYWIIVFFGYFRAPAMLIFPIWVANELNGHFFTDTNVNYMAHLGGLLAGFALVAVTKSRFVAIDEAYVEKELSDEEIFSLKVEEVWDLAGKLKLDAAWNSGVALLKTDPSSRQLLQQLFNIAKANPEGDRLHKLVTRIISVESPNSEFEHFRLMLIEDYLRASTVPRALNLENAVQLTAPTCKYQYIELGYKLATVLMMLGEQRRDVSGEISKALLRIFMIQLKDGQGERTEEIMEFLETYAGHLPEVEMARESLQLAGV